MSSKKSNLFVVKIGSGLLTDKNGGIDIPQIRNFSSQIATLWKKGYRVIMVSSGAISSGMTVLGLEKRPKDRSTLQACATIGQPRLMNAYHEAFAKHKMIVSQILITSWDIDSRILYSNTRNTLKRIFEIGNCVPIINENDAISFEEIEMLNTFGDNDRLSAHIALMTGADQLIILSGIDGLLTSPDGKGKLIHKVSAIDERIQSYAGKSHSERSVGGMVSKLETAKLMLANKIPMVIANGREKDVLIKVAKRAKVGTWFEA